MKKTNKTTEYPISALREALRLQAVALCQKLRRSVARLTSCDMLPCEEYGEEVQTEYAQAQALFCLQHCRTALEKTIATGRAKLCYRWGDGRVSTFRFQRIGPGRVRVAGPLPHLLAGGITPPEA